MDSLSELEWELEDKLEQHGFSVLEQEKKFDWPEPAKQLVVDLVLEKDGQKFFVEAKETGTISNFRDTTFFRVYAQLKAALRLSDDKSVSALMVVSIDSFDSSDLERIDRQFRKYAPEMGWILVSTENTIAYRLPEELKINVDYPEWENVRPLSEMPELSDEQESEEKMDKGSSYSLLGSQKSRWEKEKEELRFSDLELWMFKVLLFNHHPPEDWRKEPNARIANGNQLIEAAEVSPATVYSWLNAMEGQGFLERTSRKDMRLVRIGEYIHRWTGKYQIDENPNSVHFRFFKKTDNPYDQFIDNLFDADIYKQSSPDYRLTGHAGARRYGFGYSSAESIQFYRLHNDFDRIKDELGLVPDPSGESKILSFQPRYPKALKRCDKHELFHKHLNGIPLVDPFQLYLDCYALPERGREQAEFLLDELWPDIQA